MGFGSCAVEERTEGSVEMDLCMGINKKISSSTHGKHLYRKLFATNYSTIQYIEVGSSSSCFLLFAFFS